jgi:hypothetical protein
MSLYREPGRAGRARAIAAAAVLLLALGVGFAVGRATAPEPSLGSELEQIRDGAATAADALELVSIHYGAANATTRQAAREQLQRAQQQFAEVEPELAMIDAAGTEHARSAIERLARLVEQGAPANDVDRAARAAEDAVTAATPGR